MNKRRVQLVLIALVVMIVAAGCAGGPTEANWGHIMLAGEPQNILFSFSDRMVLIDPADGTPVELRDDNGNIRVDDQGNPRLWELRGNGNTLLHFYNNPTFLNENTMLAASYDRKLFEIEFPTARINNPDGRALNGHVVADLLVTDDYIYVSLSEGGLQALNRADMTQAWTFETEQGVWSKPLLVEDTLYVTSLDHHLYALNPNTGDIQWQLDLEGAVASAPVYNDGYLYVGSFGRKVFKISTAGEIVARFDTHDWVWGTPALVDGVLYVGDLGGYLYALQDNGTSFTPVWEPRKVANGAIRATPLVTEGAIIVGSRDRNTYWINPTTGEELFKREMVGEVLADPLLLEPSETLSIPEPAVIISTMAHEELLVAFSVNDGRRLWRYGR